MSATALKDDAPVKAGANDNHRLYNTFVRPIQDFGTALARAQKMEQLISRGYSIGKAYDMVYNKAA